MPGAPGAPAGPRRESIEKELFLPCGLGVRLVVEHFAGFSRDVSSTYLE
jgi:hypothetical protein